MPARYCINPRDLQAEQDVVVTDSEARPLPEITPVVDGGRDLLPDLSEACIRILQLEIAVYHGRTGPYAGAQHAVDVMAPPASA
jgi:hypothetical protein